MMKFEGLAIGTSIRAYDFEPMEGRKDRYIDGVIIEEHNQYFRGYKIRVFNDSSFGNGEEGRVGHIAVVPMEIAFDDYDGRVTVISKDD